MNIIDYIPVGEENAISQKELSVILNCSKREARAMIYEARCKGAVICSSPDSSNGGYYLPKDNQEIERFIMFQKHRISSTNEAIRSAENFLKKGGIIRGESFGADKR